MTQSRASSPEEPEYAGPDQFEARWPRVIGTMSVIYAALGMTCATGAAAWAGVANQLPEMFRGGATIAPMLQVSMIAQSLLGLILAIVLMAGGVNLLRRRASAVTTLKRWAVLRLGLILLGAAMVVVTGSAQLAMQRSVLEYRNRMLREADRAGRIVEKSDRQIWNEILRGAAIGSAVQAVYPVFIAFYLGRRRISGQLARWE